MYCIITMLLSVMC